MKGEDYEKVKGFPNYWGWGFEDNKLKKNGSKSMVKLIIINFCIYNKYKML